MLLGWTCNVAPNPPLRPQKTILKTNPKIPKEVLKSIHIANIPKYIPNGFVIKSQIYGSLNGDDIEDVLLILENPKDSTAPRPLLILTGQEFEPLNLAIRNEKAILCKSCGCNLGDPFKEVTLLPNDVFQLHFALGDDNWERKLDFQYDPDLKKWLLIREENTNFGDYNPHTHETVGQVRTPKDADFIKISLANFDANQD